MIIPYGLGYLNHNHTGPTFTFGNRTHYVECMACTLIDTTTPWPLEWDEVSRQQYERENS